MARSHTSGFEVVGFDSDPTPGDPDGLQSRAVAAYQTLGDDAADAADALRGSEVAAGSGEAMEALREKIGTDYPAKLRTTAESFHSASEAYRRYATSLAEAQGELDRAMDQALTVAATADDVVPTAPPDADEATVSAVRARESEIDEARSVLDGAKRLAQQAAEMRRSAGQQFASDLDATATVPERGFFEKIGDFFKNNPIVQFIIGVVIGLVAVFFPIVGLALGVVALGIFTAGAVASGNFDAATFVLDIVGVALGGGLGRLLKLVPGVARAADSASAGTRGFFTRATGTVVEGISSARTSVASVVRSTTPITDDAARAASRAREGAEIPLRDLGRTAGRDSPGGTIPGTTPARAPTPEPAPARAPTPEPVPARAPTPPAADPFAGLSRNPNAFRRKPRPEGFRPATPPPPDLPVATAKSPQDVFDGFLGGDAHHINGFLRNPSDPRLSAGDRSRLAAESDVVSARIAALPPVEGTTTTFRGVLGDFSQGLRPGGPFRDPAFLSTSTSRDAAERFAVTGGKLDVPQDFARGTLFAIRGNGGRDVSGLAGAAQQKEAEVLFDRATPFVVDGIEDGFSNIRVAGRGPLPLKVVSLRSPDVEPPGRPPTG